MHADAHTHSYIDMIWKQSPSIASVTAIRFCLPVFTETFSFRKDYCFAVVFWKFRVAICSSHHWRFLLVCIFAAGFFSVLPCKSLLSNKIKWCLKQSLILEIRIRVVVVCNAIESVMPIHYKKFCQIHCMLAEIENNATFSARFCLHVLSLSVFSHSGRHWLWSEWHTGHTINAVCVLCAVCKLSGMPGWHTTFYQNVQQRIQYIPQCNALDSIFLKWYQPQFKISSLTHYLIVFPKVILFLIHKFWLKQNML